MSSTVVGAPPVAAPAAAAPSAPSPAAAAPVTAPSPSVAAPEPQSAFERISAGMEQVNKEIADIKAAPEEGEVKPAAEEVKPAVAVTEEKPAGEEAAAAAATEEEKPAAKPADLPELDDGQTIAPSELAKMINDSPELKAFFDNPENQDAKNKWFAMARRLEKGGSILRMIPTEAEAKELIATSGEYHDFDSGLEKVKDAKSGVEFFDRLHNAFATTDKDGKQVTNPAFGQIRRGIFDDGMSYVVDKSVKDGQIHPVLQPVFNQLLDVVAAKATKENNADLQMAVDALREALPANSQPQRDELTPYQKEQQAVLDRREQEGNRQTLQAHQTRVTAALDGALGLAAQSSVDQAKPRIAKAGLSPTETDSVYRMIGERLEAELKANGLYDQRRKRLQGQLERDPSAENAQNLRAHMIEYQNLSLGKIITDVLNEITGGKVGRQTAKSYKVAAQVENSRTEPRGVTSAAVGPKTMTPAEERTESETLWARSNPNERMPLVFHMQRMNEKNRAEIAATGH